MNAESDETILENLVEQFTQELRTGKIPSIVGYQKQYPHLAEELHELLSSVAMIEQLKSQTPASNSLNRRLDETLNLQQLGDYRLIREIGRGGMGIVFEAMHQSLGRRVAIKILPNRTSDDQKQVDRFRREAQAAANLHHTNIVGVFGVGFDQGYHYYVMEYVDGSSLKQSIRALQARQLGELASESPDDPTKDNHHSKTLDQHGREQSSDQAGTFSCTPAWVYLPPAGQETHWALEVTAGIADALEHAHHNKVLHRDIKPANLLVDPQGIVRLTDFGLAKHMELTDLTRTGDLVGTPQYMPPESLEGKYDVRSEVYGLGLVLYELITGRAAFEPSSAVGMLHQIVTVRPKAPRQWNERISRDLEVVIQKSIARDPADRYQTAADLRDDLRCLLQDQPISARRPTAWEQTRRWSRRNPTTAIFAALTLLLLATVAVGSTLAYTYLNSAYHQLAQQHTLLESQQKQTESARQEAVASQKQLQREFERAEGNLEVSIQAFDEIFLQLVAPDRLKLNESGGAIELDIDGLSEMSGIQSGVTEQDAEFLKRMLTFYQQIADQNAEQPDLKLRSAKASRRVANTYHVIGKLEPAVEAYQTTIQQYRDLLTEQPESELIARTLAQVYNEAGQANRRLRKNMPAIRLHELARQLLTEHPASDQRSMKLELARTYNLLCASETEPPTESPAIAEDFFGLLESRESTLSKLYERRSRQRELVIRNLRFRQRMNDYLDRAIALTEELLQEAPEDPEVQLMHAISLRSKTALLINQTQETSDSAAIDPDITPKVKQVLTELTSLSEKSPNPQYKYQLALTYALSLGKPRPAEEEVETAIGLVEELINAYPNNLEYHQLRVSLQLERARHGLEQENSRETQDAMRESIQSLGVLVKTAPELLRYRLELCYVSYALAHLQLERNEPREAQRTLTRVLAELRQSERELPARFSIRRTMAKLYDLLAECHRQLGDPRRERQARTEARKLEQPRGPRNARERNERPPGPPG